MSCEEDAEIAANILGLPGRVSAVKATLLSADDMHIHNTFEEPDNIKPVTYALDDLNAPIKLPKASVLSLDIEWE